MDVSQAKATFQAIAQVDLGRPRAASLSDERAAAQAIVHVTRLLDGHLLRAIISQLDPADILAILEPLIRSWIANPTWEEIVMQIIHALIGELHTAQ